MDPVLSEFAKGGVFALAAGILLVYLLRQNGEERTRSYEERKAADKERVAAAEERAAFRSIAENSTAFIKDATHALALQGETLKRLSDDMRDLRDRVDGRPRSSNG